MRFFSVILLILAANTSFAATDFDLACHPLLRGLTTKFAVHGEVATIEATGSSIDNDLLDLFNVPEINRYAYKSYRLRVNLPASTCNFPAPFTLDGIRCHDEIPYDLTLEASTSYDATSYRYQHNASVQGVDVLVRHHDRAQGPAVIDVVQVQLSLGQQALTSSYDHECYSACAVNNIRIAKATTCGI